MTFQDLYEQYSSKVYRFALFLASDTAIADDITSETFYRVWTSHKPIQQTTAQNYLLTVAKNYFRDLQRRDVRRTQLDDSLPDRSVALESRVQASADLQRLMTLVQSLPETDRSALLLRTQQEMSYEAIADSLGITAGAAKVRVHRARTKLMELLGYSKVNLHPR